VSEAPLLVLGAGEEQVAIYQEARRRGLPTVGVDMRADRPGIALADEFLQISTTDHHAIAEALRGRRIAGVVSTAADTCLASWHELSTELGAPWRFPAAAVRVSTDKAEFHQLAAASGIPSYRWVQSDDLSAVAATAHSFRFPIVFKPADASGGRGVHRADSPSEVDAALQYAARHSPRGQVIAEEVLAGRNITVNVFLCGGELALSLITEKHTLPGPGFLIGGHTGPAELDEVTEKALLDDAHQLCLAFDLVDGPANFDVILAEDGTRYVLEVGARMSGNGFPSMVLAVSEVDWMAALVDLATGGPHPPMPSRSRPVRLHVLTSPLPGPGSVVAVGGLERVSALPGVAAVEVFVAPGDTVQPFTEAGRKLGWIVVGADRHDQLEPRLAAAVRELGLVIVPS
jgi:biotin carboxylase